jgi:hypothetical protein
MPALVGLLLVLSVTVYGLGTVSATVPRWIAIYLWASASLGWLVWWGWKERLAFDRTDAAALSLFAYAALSVSWSGDWRLGIYQSVNAGALLAVFLWLRHAPVSHVKHLPEAGLAIIVVTLIAQYLWPWDYGGHGNRNFQTEVLLIALLLGAASQSRWGKIGTAVLAVPVAGYLAFVNESKVEWFVLFGLGAWSIFLGCRYLLRRSSSSGSLWRRSRSGRSFCG